MNFVLKPQFSKPLFNLYTTLGYQNVAFEWKACGYVKHLEYDESYVSKLSPKTIETSKNINSKDQFSPHSKSTYWL